MYKDKEEDKRNPYDDERAPKSDAIQYLGEVATDLDTRMARSRFSLREMPHVTMLETQTEALNPNRKFPFLSQQWLWIKSRNHLALNGKWRDEVGEILQAAQELAADSEIAFKK
jgi:hypothetical protein